MKRISDIQGIVIIILHFEIAVNIIRSNNSFLHTYHILDE